MLYAIISHNIIATVHVKYQCTRSKNKNVDFGIDSILAERSDLSLYKSLLYRFKCLED